MTRQGFATVSAVVLLTIRGKAYTVKAHIVSCRFARTWTGRCLARG